MYLRPLYFLFNLIVMILPQGTFLLLFGWELWFLERFQNCFQQREQGRHNYQFQRINPLQQSWSMLGRQDEYQRID
jgi:hypothetical protein